MQGFNQAMKEYERYLSQPPKSDEELEEQMELWEYYQEMEAEAQFERMRLA